MKIKWWPWGLLTAISLILLLFFVLYPLGVLFANSVTGPDGGYTLQGFRALLADSQYLEAFGNTLILGLAVTACTVLVGVPFAYMVARYDFPLKNLVAILPVLTIVIPEIIVGQSWLLLLGNNGLLTNLLGDAGISLPSFYGWTGMVFSMTLVYYTYIYLGVLAALRGFDGQLEEAGLSLGTPPLTTKLRVLVPVLLPAVLVNALVVFTLVVGNFALAMLLGSRVPLLSVMTYNTFVSEMGGSPTLQSAMSVVSIAIVAIVLFFQKRVVERKVYTMTQGRAGRRAGALVGLDLLHRRRGSGDPGVAAAADHRIRGRLHQDQRAGHALGQLVAGQHAARAARRARTHPELAQVRFAGDGAGRGFAVLVSYLTIRSAAPTPRRWTTSWCCR